MSKKRSLTVTVLAVINAASIIGGIGLIVFYALGALAVLTALALSLLSGDSLAVVLAICGVVAGAALIWGIVRWVNRRDDPIRWKRPPGTP